MSSHRTDARRIQITGKATYIISLPKKWVEKSKLKKGDTVQITEQNDSTLTLFPGKRVYEEKPRAISTVVSSSDSPDSIIRRVVSFYVTGYNIIRIAAKERFTPEQRDALKDFVRRNLVGVEILTDSSNGFAIQTLLGHSELSVESALRRMATTNIGYPKLFTGGAVGRRNTPAAPPVNNFVALTAVVGAPGSGWPLGCMSGIR